jgi:hypothetical protein
MLNGGKVSPIVTLKREELDVGCWIGDVQGEELGQEAAKTKKKFTFAWFCLKNTTNGHFGRFVI